MRSFLIGGILLLAANLQAQVANEAEALVVQFFQAMAAADTVTMSSLMSDSAVLESTHDGKLQTGEKSKFMASVVRSQPGDLDEQISNIESQVHDGLATVWMDYAFYHKGKFSHCGVNNFTLAKKGDAWTIIHLADTRRKENCSIEEAKNNIHTMLDNWHKAAAEADSTGYFGLMTPDAIFVGTDSSEVWSLREFAAFAAPYFAKGKAWDFTKTSRHIYAQDYGRLAWFDEMLDTWMGPCRGSGVVVLTPDGWRVQHYVLSVTVPNDDIQEFLKIGK